MISETTIDFLRHGECKGGDIFRGSTNVELTNTGWTQMDQATLSEASNDGLYPWQLMVSSPLQRCRSYCEARQHRFGTSLVIEDNFREMDFGDWEGRSYNEVWKNDRERLDRFYETPNIGTPPNGESIQTVLERLQSSWQQLLNDRSGQHLLLVQHGGTIRILLAWLLQMPLSAVMQLHIPYGSFTRVQVLTSNGQSFPKLIFFNKLAGC